MKRLNWLVLWQAETILQNLRQERIVPLRLTDDEKKMHDGQRGEAVRMAMSILVDLGNAIDASQTGRSAQISPFQSLPAEKF